MNEIKITYFGHSCFTISAEGYSIVLDPYDESVPGYKPLHVVADECLCSHDHRDHNYVEAIDFKLGGVNPFLTDAIPSFHDEVQGAKRGTNIIRIINYEGLRIAHFGDLGEIPTEAQMKRLKGLDVALVPVGGFYTIDASTAKKILDEIKPRIIIPMHCRMNGMDYDVLDDISVFTDLYDDVKYLGSNSLDVSKNTDNGVYVLEIE